MGSDGGGGGGGGLFRWWGVFRWAVQWGEQRGKRQTLGGFKGSKGANVGGGGELNGIFLQFEFRF